MTDDSPEFSCPLQTFVPQSTFEQFQLAIWQYSFVELAEAIVLLNTHPSIDGNAKLDALFVYLSSHINLEVLSKHFTPKTFVYFLEYLSANPHLHKQLAYILIGLPPAVFSEALQLLNSGHLNLLRHEGWLESLQYQLLQFIHEGEFLRNSIEQDANQFKQDLSSAIVDQLTYENYQQLLQMVENMQKRALNYLFRMKTALAIVWHTDRMDLIEKLSKIHESIQHVLNLFIGFPETDGKPPTGLFAILEKILSRVFNDSLNDDDAAIEGMTRLSVWHLKDYWELGLLPSIQNEEDLDLASPTYREEERFKHQNELKELVQLELEKLGIGTVGDLKRFHLFSKPLLKEYIEKHRSRDKGS